jgi:hypothetical protein
MQPAELERVTGDLAWGRLTCSKEARGKIEAEADEQALHNLCQAAILRNLERFDEARTKLQEVLKLDRCVDILL